MNGAELVERLRARHKIIALGIRAARTTDAVRWAKAAGYDTIWVDMEHSSLPVDTVSQLCSCAVDIGLMPWVRVPERDYGTINRVLDAAIRRCRDADGQQGRADVGDLRPSGHPAERPAQDEHRGQV